MEQIRFYLSSGVAVVTAVGVVAVVGVGCVGAVAVTVVGVGDGCVVASQRKEKRKGSQ